MELNNYQKQVMRDLSAYLNCVNRGTNLFSAWREYWYSKDVAVGLGGVPSYNNSIERVPHVCMKVPTGGGKTFMACASVRRIFDALPTGKPHGGYEQVMEAYNVALKEEYRFGTYGDRKSTRLNSSHRT